MLLPTSEQPWSYHCTPQEKEGWQHLTVSTHTLNAGKSHNGNPTYSSKPRLPFTNIWVDHTNFDLLPLKYVKPKKNIQVKYYHNFDANSDSPISGNNNSRV